MIYYSIIIPHKNIPILLERCLNTIPCREDLEIIIVDDKSDPIVVNFSDFPGKDRIDVKIIFTNEGKGAGYARNVGLSNAQGKWIIFADADDYFTENFNLFLDKYKNSESEVIYFKPTSITYLENKELSTRVKTYIELFEGDLNFLRYAYITPWGKFIRRCFIEKNNFLFSEVQWANDTLFMTKVGTTAEKIEIVKNYLYVVDERDGSLTHAKVITDQEIVCRIVENIRSYHYAESIGFKPYEDILLIQCLSLVSEKRWNLFRRTVHSLPKTAYLAIKKRLFYRLSFRGKLLYSLLYISSHFTNKLV